MKLTSEQIKKVVNYWTNQLIEGCGDQQGENAGFEDEQKSMMDILSMMIRDAADITDTKINNFSESLTRILTETNVVLSDDLSVDYCPGDILAQAAEEADIPEEVFPFKHYMMFGSNGKIEVKEGYNAKYRELV